MIRIENKNGDFFAVFSSDSCHIITVLEKAGAFLTKKGIGKLPEISVVLRELLLNAVVHGNKNDTAKQVKCLIQINNSRYVELIVEDEGDGFDPDTVDSQIPEDPQKLKKRGYILIQSLSDSVVFDKGGTIITASMNVK